jgi:8-oxo-dGTP pyrophosphatase MutT (NUDIX family)
MEFKPENKEKPPLIETVRGALFYKGKFLILEKDADSKNPKAMEFAGGKIDDIKNKISTDEEQIKALKDEVFQETRIDISKLSPEKIDDFEIFFETTDKDNIKKQYRRLVHLFLTRIPDTEEIEIKVNETKNEEGGSEDKHASYKWVTPEELIKDAISLEENKITGEKNYPLSRNSRHIKKLIEKVS